MEEINNVQPSSNGFNNTTNDEKESESLSDMFNKPISRRGFLKGFGLAVAATSLTACGPKGMLEAGDKKDDLIENVRELNRQFDQINERFLRPDKFFNYNSFIEKYPGFENYKEAIEKQSLEVSGMYNMSPNVMRALASSIVASNLNTQDPIREGNQFNQRVGVMQFFPIHLFDSDKIKNDRNFPNTVEELTQPEANIRYGLQYLIEGLREIKNDGENRNIIELMLAQYYGKDALAYQIKHNKEITEDSFLWSNYVKYKNTLRALGMSSETPKSYENQYMEEVWNRAVENWPDSKLNINREILLKEAEKYFNDEHNQRLGLSADHYLALFIAVAITESYGGKYVINKDSGALGWYQLIPKWRHLEDFNALHGTNYTYEQIVDNDAISIEVGIWTLMRYRDYMNIKELMQMFKGGHRFGEYPDDYKWWNSVSQNMNLLLGDDVLALTEY
jgi:hypothetical protein